MTLILLLGLLQADDLAAFLASLEKDRAKGATQEALLKQIESWSAGKPEETVARLAWNKGFIEAGIKIDALFVEGLKKRLGQQVTIGRSTGVIKEVKADRVVLSVSGGTIELTYSTIGPDIRLEDIKKAGLLPEKSSEEAIFRFAASKTPAAAMALAGDDRERALTAIAGWVLQESDKLATVKAAENLAATWGKQAELLAANGGALRRYIDATLAPKLVDDADAVIEKDRKEARKLLDLAASICKAPEILEKISERRWSVLDKGEWMAIPLEGLSTDGGEMKGSAIFYEDTEKEEKGKVTGLRITSLGVSWDEISGVRARVKPGKTDMFDMRFSFNKRKVIQSITVQPNETMAYRVTFEPGKEPKVGAGSSRRVSKKTDYEFSATWEGKKWKVAVAGTDIDSFENADIPEELMFIVSDGTGEVLSISVRKK